ncbi:MAG: hypothetical protein ACRDSP_19950 [Pseudonocardiaceae bacterium]
MGDFIDMDAARETDPVFPSADKVSPVPSADEVPPVPSADDEAPVPSADEGPVADPYAE